MKSDLTDKLILKLNIIPQNKPFKISYNIKCIPIKNKQGFFRSVAGNNNKEIVTFSYEVPFKDGDSWNSVEIIIQEKLESLWFNGQLKGVYASNKPLDYPLQQVSENLMIHIDNLRIKTIDNNQIPDLEKFLELAKDVKKYPPPFGKMMDSPVPKIKKGEVSVFWGHTEN